MARPARGRLIRRIRGLTAPRDKPELLEILRDAQTQGLLDADDYAMLEGALEVSELQVRDIMVPRNQMISVRHDDPPARVLQVVIDSGHSRFPVMEADTDGVCGILLAKDLLRLGVGVGSASALDLDQVMRKPVFVPESKRVNLLLKELRQSRNHMAIVVDEYGGVAGLVTIEDVIEEIVGEIDDEFDVAENNIREEGERQYSVRGATTIEEFNERFDAAFPDEDASTIAGLVMQQFGRLPRRGESVTIDGFEFRVVRADRRRIEGLRVTVPQRPTHPHDSASDDSAAAAHDRGVA